jgi:hypothetical protein
MRALPLLLALALAGCGHRDDDAATGGLSPDEARQLNEAAASIDVNASLPSNDTEDGQ